MYFSWTNGALHQGLLHTYPFDARVWQLPVGVYRLMGEPGSMNAVETFMEIESRSLEVVTLKVRDKPNCFVPPQERLALRKAKKHVRGVLGQNTEIDTRTVTQFPGGLNLSLAGADNQLLAYYVCLELDEKQGIRCVNIPTPRYESRASPDCHIIKHEIDGKHFRIAITSVIPDRSVQVVVESP
jgi:hypothetical protein